ncbi:ComF family protein [Taibaiella chishuiensis]|uniref:ComF family protein n=1 Tax=Taibaiella chishuiensis TaxID=1434707 RepID=A0A2P8DCY1_9BACT|nr:phosphoribosyltransferase family protein [Taibaiella chishuiensis]PSK95078.1 ComF family protein [Taibaiella chishuiensis]
MAFNFVKTAANALSGLFFPDLCAACDRALSGSEQVLCLHCLLNLPRTGLHRLPENKVQRLFTGRLPLVRATAFTYFTKDGMMQHLLHQLKYKGRAATGSFLGNVFGQELQADGWLEATDLLVPVPLHRQKAYRRGFNQAALIAGGIAAATSLPVAANALERVRDTGSQTRKSRLERLDNVATVFRAGKAAQIRGKRLLLVDDVLTTGATLEAAGLALLEAGAASLGIATLALATD